MSKFGAHAAGWSSQVARRAHNPKVAGSNPAPATAKALHMQGFRLLEGLSWCRSRCQFEPPNGTTAVRDSVNCDPDATSLAGDYCFPARSNAVPDQRRRDFGCSSVAGASAPAESGSCSGLGKQATRPAPCPNRGGVAGVMAGAREGLPCAVPGWLRTARRGDRERIPGRVATAVRKWALRCVQDPIE
jgi:hypothetical protein